MDARFMQMHNLVLTREVIINSMFPVDRMRERNIHRETAAPKYNKPPMKSFYCTNIEMLKWQLLHQRILWPIFMEYCGLTDINQRLFIC